MGLSRARGVALQIMLALALAVGVAAPAAATERRSAPSVSLRAVSAGVVVSGRTAAAAPKVRLDRYTASGWSVVKRIRAHHHRYSTRLSLAAGTTATFRAVSDHRSRKFVVRIPAPAPRPTLYDGCGARPWKADGTAWSCTFDDEFNGTALDRTKWVPQTVFAEGSPSAYTCYRDDPSNVSVSNGALNLTVLKLDAPAPCGRKDLPPTPYQSGSVSTYHLFSQQYGRFEARIRNTASTVPGLHEAFWLWPDDRYPSTAKWPTAGEIDIVESYSVKPNLAVPFLHYSADSGGPQAGLNTAWNCTAYRGQWNNYTLEWGPSRLAISVNGKTCLVNTSGDPAFRKPYIAAFTQALGVNDNALTSGTPIPATMSIDYLRVWG